MVKQNQWHSSTSLIGSFIFIFCLLVKDIRSEANVEVKLQLTNWFETTISGLHVTATNLFVYKHISIKFNIKKERVILGVLNSKMQATEEPNKSSFFVLKLLCTWLSLKIHCALLATNKFSIVGVLHMLNWKRPGISLAKQYVGEKPSKEALYI